MWLACILSEGDHRLSHVAQGVKDPQHTRRRCIGSKGTPRALTDERLATPLDSLCVAARWVEWERARKQSVRRVDDVLGVPWTTTVVAGNTAEAPLALPEMATVRQRTRITGLPSVGACPRAALGTRAAIVAPQDAAVCPRAATPRPEAALDRVLAPVLSGALEPRAVRVPNADGARAETADPVATGFASTVARSAPDQSGQPRTWPERRLVVRSLAVAARQEKHRRQRVARAVTALNALAERPQGKPLLPDEAAASRAAAALMATQRVEGLGQGTVTTAVHASVTRRDGTRPATPVRRARVRAGREEVPLAQAARRVGWRVYATHPPAEELRLAQGGAASRRESLLAPGVGRLQGRSLALTPLCLPSAHRVVGLLCLLRLARRVLVVRQGVVRRHLQRADSTRQGISPGQPGRQPATPTTAMLRLAVRGVTRSRIKSDGKNSTPI